MIETIIINYLSKKLDIPVYAEIPENAPEQFFIVEKTGSSIVNRLRHATVAIQSYAGTMLDAAKLNDELIEKMLLIPEVAEVSACELNSDYNYTDTTTKRYRYQAVFELTYHD